MNINQGLNICHRNWATCTVRDMRQSVQEQKAYVQHKIKSLVHRFGLLLQTADTFIYVGRKTDIWTSPKVRYKRHIQISGPLVFTHNLTLWLFTSIYLQFWHVGVVTAIGISMHNFPEGIYYDYILCLLFYSLRLTFNISMVSVFVCSLSRNGGIFIVS